MICYQKDVKKSSAVKCGRGDFWREVKSQKTAWHIDARRAVKAAVKADLDGKGVAAIHTWLQNADFQKFLIRKPKELKSEKAKKTWAKKSDEEKLLAWAEELKQELTGFIFSCYLFDEVKRKKKKKDGTEFEVTERPRQLKYCHLNGLVMLDIDHVENPMQIWWKLREMQELMDRVALVHISCSGDGIRIIFTADLTLGNLADNQIVFAKALGYKADSSCIDASRTSFCPTPYFQAPVICFSFCFCHIAIFCRGKQFFEVTVLLRIWFTCKCRQILEIIQELLFKGFTVIPRLVERTNFHKNKL